MERFSKILVGVDLGWADRTVAEELSEPNLEAVRQALWLAKANSASVHFLFCLDLSAKALQLIRETSGSEVNVLQEAETKLANLVAEANSGGIEADSSVVIGKSWLQIIHQVLKNKYDLVVIGTRHKGVVEGLLLGSTATKLVRKCPCAVWVTKPLKDNVHRSIVVAHDLRSVGEHALELGCSMAESQKAHLHVVHAAEFNDYLDMMPDAFPREELIKDYREKVEQTIKQQLDRIKLTVPATVHVPIESPEFAILDCAKKNHADLIVIGTVGRTGISGFITGNTAERLLPRIPCSLLTVKPAEFRSPVELTEA